VANNRTKTIQLPDEVSNSGPLTLFKIKYF